MEQSFIHRGPLRDRSGFPLDRFSALPRLDLGLPPWQGPEPLVVRFRRSSPFHCPRMDSLCSKAWRERGYLLPGEPRACIDCKLDEVA